MQVKNSPSHSTININNHKKEAQESLAKIGSAKNKQLDDAALALIANAIGSDISGLVQGVKNANDAVSIMQIADGVLSGVAQGAEDLNVLAVKSNSAALNSSQKAGLRSEADAIIDSLQKSVGNASFNGQPIFGRSLEFNLGNSVISATIGALELDDFDRYSQEGIADFVKNVQNVQIEVGGTLNELESAISSIFTQISSLSATKSQMSDTDMAKEVMDFDKESIALKASLIAQAHSSKLSAQSVARLLE